MAGFAPDACCRRCGHTVRALTWRGRVSGVWCGRCGSVITIYEHMSQLGRAEGTRPSSIPSEKGTCDVHP